MSIVPTVEKDDESKQSFTITQMWPSNPILIPGEYCKVICCSLPSASQYVRMLWMLVKSCHCTSSENLFVLRRIMAKDARLQLHLDGNASLTLLLQQ